jgi:hypothetical protein
VPSGTDPFDRPFRRYVWRYRDNKTLEIKVRRREEPDQLVTAQNKSDVVDLFVRMTSGFTLVER